MKMITCSPLGSFFSIMTVTLIISNKRVVIMIHQSLTAGNCFELPQEKVVCFKPARTQRSVKIHVCTYAAVIMILFFQEFKFL